MESCQRLFQSTPTPLEISSAGASYVRIYPVTKRTGVMAGDPLKYVEAGIPSNSAAFEELLTITIDINTIVNVEKNVQSLFLDLTVEAYINPGGGPGTGQVKWMVSDTGDINDAVDLSDTLPVISTPADLNRSDSIILPNMEKLPFYLHLVGKVDDVNDQLIAGVTNESAIDLTYYIL